jgi:hypothetical protein
MHPTQLQVPICVLYYGPDDTLVIQAAESQGDSITLQNYEDGNTYQQWYVTMQMNDNGDIGFAFISVASVLANAPQSITYNGPYGNLVMQSYSFGSTDQDAWLIAPATQSSDPAGTYRVVYPANPNFSFNDRGGAGQPGDNIMLNDDLSPNSTWSPAVSLGTAHVEQPSVALAR